jgi:hypothetical protein
MLLRMMGAIRGNPYQQPFGPHFVRSQGGGRPELPTLRRCLLWVESGHSEAGQLSGDRIGAQDANASVDFRPEVDIGI